MTETNIESLKKGIKSVRLINEEELEVSLYQSYLDKLAQGSAISSEIFTNEGKAYASILMATLLENTEHEVKMYCQGLSPGILSGKDENDKEGYNGAYWDVFKRFFGETLKSSAFREGSIEILIQKEDWLNNQPFKKIGEALRDVQCKNKVIVKKITNEAKEYIEKVLGDRNNVNYNFAIFDGKAFRLEYNPNGYQAIGSFNNPSWCEWLTGLFNFAFSSAKDITQEVAENN